MALPGVSILLVKKGVGAMAIGTTDAQGRYTFTVEIDTGQYSVVARKLGYDAATRHVELVANSTLRLTIALDRTAQALDPVHTVAEQLPSKNYFLDSSEIGASTRGIFNAFDAIRKLRPPMLGDVARLCPSAQNVWINGMRVWWGRAVLLSKPIRVSQSAGAMTSTSGSTGMHPSRLQPRSASISTADIQLDSVLAMINSEHIAEVRYVNCWDTSTPEIGTNDALYFILKPGFGWSWKYGTYLADSVAAGVRPPDAPLLVPSAASPPLHPNAARVPPRARGLTDSRDAKLGRVDSSHQLPD